MIAAQETATQDTNLIARTMIAGAVVIALISTIQAIAILA